MERPDLEDQRNELVVKINSDKAQLKSIEDKILYLLYHSEGNILDDEELIETLNESKETSAIIEARLIETEATEVKISVAREKYRNVATKGSVLYFVVANLAEIDPMYQFSLKYFNQVNILSFINLLRYFNFKLQIFNNVIIISEKSKNLDHRLNILHKEITLAVYTNVSRGLFERHKLVFSFMLNVAIFQNLGLINDSQWNYLLRGPIGFKGPCSPKPDVQLITDQMWLSANYLATMFPKFKKLLPEVTKVIELRIGEFYLVTIVLCCYLYID